MDSLTQATLGAVVADACLGRQLGRPAIAWGLALGTLPDLDIIAGPLLSTAEYLYWHRSWSHSLVVMLLATPALTWLLRRVYGERVNWRRGLAAVGLIYATHVLIDCYTVYGTGLFEPISDAWVAANLLFIIDPLFTLPLIAATVIALITPWRPGWRRWSATTALALAAAYSLWAIGAKLAVDARFERQLAEQDIVATRWQSTPTIMNTLLWRALVEGEHAGEPGFWVGYASLLDDHDHVHWRWIPQRPELAAEAIDGAGFEAMRWFSRGYWIARHHDEDGLRVADLRFGGVGFASADPESLTQPWIFCWAVDEAGAAIRKRPPEIPPAGPLGAALWRRIGGERFDWERAESPQQPP